MKIYVIPTHHWDPFWEHPPDVSARMGVRNLRKALDIIQENSEFKYVIAQTYLWELFKKYFPERVEEFKERVKEGKIGLACGGYVNPDFNLPSGESLIRQMAFNKRVWQEEFGVSPEIVWIQDSFGQPAQLPQIFSKLGLKFHTAKRGPANNLPAVFVWEGVDGSQILFDRQPLGHHGLALFPGFSYIPNRIEPWEKLEKIAQFPLFSFLLALIALYLPNHDLWFATKGTVCRFKAALKYLSKFYPDKEIFVPHGFGFDGALPVNWISHLCKIYSALSKDQMFIASPSEFLESLEQKRNELTVVKGELNGPRVRYGEASGTLPGTYSTRMDVKIRARKMEKLLYLAELLEILRYLKEREYRDFTEIWKAKSLTDFHDGICGSLTDDNYLILKKKAETVIKECQRIIRESLKTLSPQKAILNPLPWPRQDIVKIDRKWRLIEASTLGISPLKILEPVEKFQCDQKTKTLITPFYKVGWGNNRLTLSRNQGFLAGKEINIGRLRLQKEKGDTYFWNVSGEKWDKVRSIRLLELNGARAVLEIQSVLGKIEILQKVHFYLHTPRVDFLTKVKNQEKDFRLQACFPLGVKAGSLQLIREIPAGFLKEGESMGQASWKSVCGKKFSHYDNIKCVQNWLFFGNNQGLAIFNDGLPEHELARDKCFLTLLRGIGRLGTEGKGLFGRFRPESVPWRAGAPHPIPLAQEQGKHQFRYAFYPGKREEISRECYEFLFPLVFCQGKGDVKNLSLFSLSDKNVIPLAIKKAEKGKGIAIRLLETEGKKKDVEIRLNPSISFKTAELTDLMEEKISDLTIKNNVVEIKFGPQEIVTLILKK